MWAFYAARRRGLGARASQRFIASANRVRRKSTFPSRLSDCYQPFPRQEEFHRSRAKYRLFGGSAGPGKTKALLWEAIYQAQEGAGAESLLLRRTYPELATSLLADSPRGVPPSI